jgi:hypothetical protein
VRRDRGQPIELRLTQQRIGLVEAAQRDAQVMVRDERRSDELVEHRVVELRPEVCIGFGQGLDRACNPGMRSGRRRRS